MVAGVVTLHEEAAAAVLARRREARRRRRRRRACHTPAPRARRVRRTPSATARAPRRPPVEVDELRSAAAAGRASRGRSRRAPRRARAAARPRRPCRGRSGRRRSRARGRPRRRDREPPPRRACAPPRRAPCAAAGARRTARVAVRTGAAAPAPPRDRQARTTGGRPRAARAARRRGSARYSPTSCAASVGVGASTRSASVDHRLLGREPLGRVRATHRGERVVLHLAEGVERRHERRADRVLHRAPDPAARASSGCARCRSPVRPRGPRAARRRGTPAGTAAARPWARGRTARPSRSPPGCPARASSPRGRSPPRQRVNRSTATPRRREPLRHRAHVDVHATGIARAGLIHGRRVHAEHGDAGVVVHPSMVGQDARNDGGGVSDVATRPAARDAPTGSSTAEHRGVRVRVERRCSAPPRSRRAGPAPPTMAGAAARKPASETLSATPRPRSRQRHAAQRLGAVLRDARPGPPASAAVSKRSRPPTR